jgi:hypothetical protein
MKDTFNRVLKTGKYVTGPDADDDKLPKNWEYFDQLSFLTTISRYNDPRFCIVW